MQNEKAHVLSLITDLRSDKVSEAQLKLMELSSSAQFLETIFSIISDPNQQEEWIKQLASSFLNRVICQRLQYFGYARMFSAVKSILECQTVQAAHKRLFERSIVSLIDFIQEPDQIDQWRQLINGLMANPKLFDSSLLLISCTSVAEIHPDYLCIVVLETFDQTLRFLMEQVNIENSVVLNEFLKNWIVVVDKLKSIPAKDSEEPAKVLEKICKSDALAKIVFEVYQLNAPEQVWVCCQPELYQLNLLKHQAAQLHRKLGEYIINHIVHHSIDCLKFSFIDMLIQYQTKLMNSIAIIGNKPHLLETFQCQNFVTSLFGLVIVLIKANGKSIGKNRLQVWMHVGCFPFLSARNDELAIFEENQVEFNSLAEDICDKQTFGLLKTEAARLLQIIGDTNKECLYSTLRFSIECLKMRLGFIEMPQQREGDIKIMQVQKALTILSIYSYNLEKYPEILSALKIIMCDKRMMQLAPLQTSRVLLFLAYNFSDVFATPTDGSMWVEFAFTYQKHPTTRYIAMDFISNIADEYFSQEFFDQIINLINIETGKGSGQMWSIVLKVLDCQLGFNEKQESMAQNQYKLTEQKCIALVQAVFSRIESEITKIQSQQKESTMDIINALHVLITIAQNPSKKDKKSNQPHFLDDKPSLTQSLMKITQMYSQSVELQVDDELVKILIELINNKKYPINISDMSSGNNKVLELILKQFAKDQYKDRTYFILMNELINQATNFAEIKPIFKTLISGLMFHLFDMSKQAQKLQIKTSMANILTLLQNMLSVHGYEIASTSESDYFNQIGAMCVRLFPDDAITDKKGQPVIFSKPLLAKALNLMLLCHLYQHAENTITYLAKYSPLEGVFCGYDAFILIRLLSKAFFMEKNIDFVIEYLNVMIEVTQQETNNKNKKSSSKTTATAKGKMKLKRTQQLDKILLKITCPFITQFKIQARQEFPIRKQFQECLAKLKSSNIDTYKLILLNLTEQKKSKLLLLVSEVLQVEGKARVIRKVTGAKMVSTEGVGVELERSSKPQIGQNNEESDDDEQDSKHNDFKRRRVLTKRKEGKKIIREDKAAIELQ